MRLDVRGFAIKRSSPSPKTRAYVILAAEEIGLILVYVAHRFPSAEADVENLGNENKVESIVDTLDRNLRLGLSDLRSFEHLHILVF
jgi:hypothetical protein